MFHVLLPPIFSNIQIQTVGEEYISKIIPDCLLFELKGIPVAVKFFSAGLLNV